VRSPRNLLVRLLGPYVIALVAVAASLYAYSDAVVERLYLETLSERLLREAQLIGNQLPWDLRGAPLDQRCAALRTQTGTRVTVIAADGTVIGESEKPSATLENHRERPEIQAALRDGDGHSVRLSASVHRPLFYRAWRQTTGPGGEREPRVIRVAVPMATIQDARHRIRAAIWGGLAVAALAALWPVLRISRRLAGRVSRLAAFSNAVAAGQNPPPLAPEGDDVVGRLETNLAAMARSLSAQLQAAREEKGKLEAVLGGMVEGVLVIDRTATIRLSNQRADQLLGSADNRALVGQPLIQVTRDPDLHELVRAVMRNETPAPRAREVTLDTARGREHLQVTATPIVEDEHEPRAFILVFHDITALKKLETTRRDFVANVSHELRTPLTAIRGYAETLHSGALADPQLAPRFLGVIERHCERLGRLIDDLLALSDLELGRTELQRGLMPLAPTLDAAIEILRDKAARGEVEIRRELPPDLPPLYADPDRVEQILVNLIDNAVKYTPAGGRVTIRAQVANGSAPAASVHERAPGRPYVEIAVMDTGVGVPSQDLPRLTERFYRVDKARSRELGGTGLGLAIVKHLVQAHGGTLRIESQLGHGTCVRVCLPADAAPVPS
jgi:two-component system, OmpR family, phosphate regulon sensor histidine kinase PhoR